MEDDVVDHALAKHERQRSDLTVADVSILVRTIYSLELEVSEYQHTIRMFRDALDRIVELAEDGRLTPDQIGAEAWKIAYDALP